jgi:hypothetical protein
MVLDKWAEHEILETKQWIAVIEDKINLGRTFRINLSQYPPKALLRIGYPLQVLSRVSLIWVRLESW